MKSFKPRGRMGTSLKTPDSNLLMVIYSYIYIYIFYIYIYIYIHIVKTRRHVDLNKFSLVACVSSCKLSDPCLDRLLAFTHLCEDMVEIWRRMVNNHFMYAYHDNSKYPSHLQYVLYYYYY